MSEWQPIEDGEHEAQHSADSFFVDGDWLTVQEYIIGSEDTQIATIVLPDDIRLCRRVPDSPDLLSACEKLLQMIDSGDYYNDEICNQAKAAIAKAKGE